ncbi:MAG: hypothetical protein M1819_007451 [Sarea resinae]|nr:MAG: hypothetical protein M1819_007451 [Sarea resinae]
MADLTATPSSNSSNSHYVYEPASSTASRTLIDEARIRSQATDHATGSSTTHQPPLPTSFRPTLPTRSSFNYAQAEAAARAEKGPTGARDVVGDFFADEAGRPTVVRHQSWSEQDFKRKMQGGLMAGEADGTGFSEKPHLEGVQEGKAH